MASSLPGAFSGEREELSLSVKTVLSLIPPVTAIPTAACLSLPEISFPQSSWLGQITVYTGGVHQEWLLSPLFHKSPPLPQVGACRLVLKFLGQQTHHMSLL